MRCTCCNAILTDYEATMRHAISKQFIEVCSECLKSIEAFIPTQVRNDLLTEADTSIAGLVLDGDNDYIDDGLDDDIDDYWNER